MKRPFFAHFAVLMALMLSLLPALGQAQDTEAQDAVNLAYEELICVLLAPKTDVGQPGRIEGSLFLNRAVRLNQGLIHVQIISSKVQSL